MCGIAGIISNDYDQLQKVRQMAQQVQHRGPDAEDFYFGRNIALGHRRLAILDLSKAGRQPMAYLQKYQLIFNGEIYNYLELRQELQKYGYEFRTGTDSEVILAAFDKWGAGCVNRFNGMWAFAIYDEEKKELFCSRDRFGIKPFYYISAGGFFAFGSEIRQLLPLLASRKANVPILMDYLTMSLEDHREDIFFEGIKKLSGGHNLIFQIEQGRFTIQKYYTLQPDPSFSDIAATDAVALFQEKFEDAVRLRLRSDVKVGTCLSGGLDSSSIAAVAAEIYTGEAGERFNAITAVSVQKEKDESAFAQEVVERCALQWHQTAPDTSVFMEKLDEVVRLQEEPFGSPSIFMQYFVMEKARHTGNVVLLDGQGGDELLLGYERYYPAILMALPLWKAPKEAIQAAQNSKLSLPDLVKFYAYFTNSAIREKRLRSRFDFVKRDALDVVDWQVLKELASSYKDIQQLQILELTKTQLPHLLRYEDKNSMRFSIESRLPMLDYRLVEFCLSLPPSLKIKNGWTKWILRKSMENRLPDSIIWRKNKFGFEAPVQTWLNRKQLDNHILNSTLLRNITTTLPLASVDDKTYWKLLNIAKWEEAYDVTR